MSFVGLGCLGVGYYFGGYCSLSVPIRCSGNPAPTFLWDSDLRVGARPEEPFRQAPTWLTGG
jgi:hypothetical protein